jgi:hypothetical protein
MAAKSRKLAETLAARLGPTMPSGFRIEAQAGQLSLFRGLALIGTLSATDIVDDFDDRSPSERLGVAVLATLSAVQDCIAESLGEPWPRNKAEDMALPHAEVDGKCVRAWFGDEMAPVLLLPSIELGEFELPP